MTTVDAFLLIIALACCVAVVLRIGDARALAFVAGALIVVVLIGVTP